MRITAEGYGDLVLEEVYTGVLLRTKEGNEIGICMRDDTFEIVVLPQGKNGKWHHVNMETGLIEIEQVNDGEAITETSCMEGQTNEPTSDV